MFNAFVKVIPNFYSCKAMCYVLDVLLTGIRDINCEKVILTNQ